MIFYYLKKSYQDLTNEGSTTPSDNFWLCKRNFLYSFGFVQGPCWHFALNFPLCNKNLNSFLTSQPVVPEVFGLEFPWNPKPLWPFGYQPQIRFQQMQTWRIKNTKINYYKIQNYKYQCKSIYNFKVGNQLLSGAK